MSKRLLFVSIVVVPLFTGAAARAHDAAEAAPVPPVAAQHGPYIVNNIHTLGNSVHPHGGPAVLASAPRETEPPAVFLQTLQGLLAGGLVGTGIGYLTVHDASSREPWRNVVCGAGVGALSGGGLGLGLGLLDAGFGGRSAARYVMRDTLYGTGAGALFGSAIGGLVALNSRDEGDVLVGGAIGAISGALLGVVAGVVEGQWRARRPRARTHVSLRPGLVRGHDSGGHQVWMSGVSGRF